MNSLIVFVLGLVAGLMVGRMWKFWEEDKKLQKAHEMFLNSDGQFIEMAKLAKEAQRVAILAVAQRDHLLAKFSTLLTPNEKETIN